MAKGGGGKALAGCSCLSVIFFLMMIIGIRFGLTFAVQALPDLAAVWAFLGNAGWYIANACCCLSGLGFLIGIGLSMMGGGKDEFADV